MAVNDHPVAKLDLSQLPSVGRPPSRLRSVATTLAVGLLVCGGCDPPPVVGPAVAGTITVIQNGQPVPLADGLITWEPASGTPGAKVSARIEHGHYEIGADAGLQAGNYRVEVMVMPPDIAAAMRGVAPDGPPQTFREIDSQFNSRTMLKHRLQLDQPNRFDAEVTYRPE